MLIVGHHADCGRGAFDSCSPSRYGDVDFDDLKAIPGGQESFSAKTLRLARVNDAKVGKVIAGERLDEEMVRRVYAY
jgi:hypothetical protein